MNRLSDIVVGLQRMAEGARYRGEDIRYQQQQEVYDHIQWLDQQLSMVEKVRSALLDERKKFTPVENRVDNKLENRVEKEPVPKFIQKGPAT